MAQSGPIISGVAGRYAHSLFDLAREQGTVEAVEAELTGFEDMLAESADLRRLVESPVFSADQQFDAIDAVLKRAGVGGLVGNFLRVVARNRRLFAVPAMIRAFREIAADARGEATAEITAAHELTPEQETELKATLKAVAGKDVAIKVTIDPSILGGLIVKMGSRQIDTSLKTKLNSLKLVLKEVG